MSRFIKGLVLVAPFLMVGASAADQNDLTHFAQKTAQIEAIELAAATKSWDGSQLPRYPTGQPEIKIIKYRIAQGATLPLHQHPFINAGVLLKGQLHVEKQDGTTLLLNAGDTIIELVNQWHLGKSIGDEDAEIIVFYAGVKGQPIVVKASN